MLNAPAGGTLASGATLQRVAYVSRRTDFSRAFAWARIPTASLGAASPTFTTSALDGQAIISPDRVPLGLTKMNSDFQERIIAILRGSPHGLTSNEIAQRLGATAGNISSRLSKLAAYGIIGKTRYSRGPRGNVYRTLTDEQAAM